MNNSDIILQYKEREPIKTIEQARSKLANIGIIAKEEWNNIGTNIFSVQLTVFETSIIANGKGCTKELALASAYGELIERLSFLLPFRVSPFFRMFYKVINDRLKEKDNSLFKYMSFEDWINTEDAEVFFLSLQEQSKGNSLNRNEKKAYQKFKTIWEKRKDECFNCFLCAEFKQLKPGTKESNNIFSEKVMMLPYIILDYYYGSNGMCAGNTEEEALTQGICEIIERYEQKRIILGGYENIFDITDSYLKQNSNINRVNALLKKSGYSIKILECITVFDIPVAAVVIQRRDGFYYVSFGCHPDIFVAAERAIDELFQGYSMETIDLAFTGDYAINLNILEEKNNYFNLLKYGVGIYPPGFILGKFPVKQIQHNNIYKTNKHLLNGILSSLNNRGLRVYACKGLELGLFSYHVIILGISEAENILPSNKIRCSGIEDIYENLSNITRDEALKLASHCEMLYKSHCETLEALLDIDKYVMCCGCETSVKGISATIFIVMLNIKAQRWEQAAFFLEQYIKELSCYNTINLFDLQYYQALLVILKEKASDWSDNQIIDSLNGADVDIKGLMEVVNGEEDLFEELPLLTADKLLLNSTSLNESVMKEAVILSNLVSMG